MSYLFIYVQSADNTTVAAVVVHNATVIEKVVLSTTEHVKVVQTTVSSHMNSTTNVSQKAIVSSYVEPPPHPLGYCIRSRLNCSKIRRCCKGPCDVPRKKCP